MARAPKTTAQAVTARHASRTRGSRYKELVESLEAIVWRCDAETYRFTFVSRQAETLLGYPVERWLDEPDFWKNAIHPEDRDWAVSFCVEATRQKRAHKFEYRMISADGRIVWIRDIVHVVVEDGAPRELIGVMIDITEYRDAAEDFRRQKEVLQKIFDHVPAMLSFTGEDGRIKLVNREWERTIGWSLAEIVTQNLDVFASAYPDPQDRRDVDNFIGAANGTWADFKARAKDGRTIATTWARVRLSDGTTIGIGQDITQRKQAEEFLRESEERFRRLV